jgi:hypothetical protein
VSFALFASFAVWSSGLRDWELGVPTGYNPTEAVGHVCRHPRASADGLLCR